VLNYHHDPKLIKYKPKEIIICNKTKIIIKKVKIIQFVQKLVRQQVILNNNLIFNNAPKRCRLQKKVKDKLFILLHYWKIKTLNKI